MELRPARGSERDQVLDLPALWHGDRGLRQALRRAVGRAAAVLFAALQAPDALYWIADRF